MTVKLKAQGFVDEKYGIIKNIYDLPTYYGLPKVYVKMAFGGQYNTAGFNASGAGITEAQAVNSAVGEYIERYSCLHPHRVMKVSKGVVKINPQTINASASANVDDYQWIHGYDLIQKRTVALPVDAVYLTYRSNKKQSWMTTATGAACGTNLKACFWKGIAEIFERDAFQYIWRRQIACEQIRIHDNRELRSYFNRYIKSENIQFKLYKMDMDWDVPAVFGVAILPNKGCVVAASVRPTWIEACKKTLLELAQSIVGYAAIIFKVDENIEVHSYDEVKEYQDHSLLYFNDHMSQHLSFLDGHQHIFRIPENEIQPDDDEAVALFIEKTKSIDKQVYFVDVTSEEIKHTDWKVGKTIIPGMLDIEPHFIKHLESSRLNEVDRNLIKMKKRQPNELKNSQPIVPHPFP
ncbi:YcaO-like family protein [Staphylococcus pseudintermedius]|uniref:YcaO-like family protein n=1 Tax=Staphylococcus pseudintermedius TaxID=283734 RepID=UPI0013769ADD|nr:YcaO-like family protein [Staphylococcus pseudintermedius]